MKSQFRGTKGSDAPYFSVSIAYLLQLVIMAFVLVILYDLNSKTAVLVSKSSSVSSEGAGILNAAGVKSPAAPVAKGAREPISTRLPSMREIVMNQMDANVEGQTDKITHHRYDRFYEYFLNPLRENPIKMLEIGFFMGSSYHFWLRYFVKGDIYFMEKDQGRKYPKARFTGDQSSVKDMRRMLTEKNLEGALDLIVDDGSHVPSHQIVTFKFLWEKGLKPGGIYIVEDTEMNYWSHGLIYGNKIKGGKDHPDSIVTQFKALIDVVNRQYAPTGKPFNSSFGPHVDTWIQSIFFGDNCVVLIKMTEEERAFFLNRVYRLKRHVDPVK